MLLDHNKGFERTVSTLRSRRHVIDNVTDRDKMKVKQNTVALQHGDTDVGSFPVILLYISFLLSFFNKFLKNLLCCHQVTSLTAKI